MTLEEKGFSIIDPADHNKRDFFIFYENINDVTTVNTFTCTLR